MSRLKCRCGYIMRMAGMSEDFELIMIKERFIDELDNLAAKHRDMPAVKFMDVVAENILLNRKEVLHCPQCGRYLIQVSNDLFESYKKEE